MDWWSWGRCFRLCYPDFFQFCVRFQLSQDTTLRPGTQSLPQKKCLWSFNGKCKPLIRCLWGGRLTSFRLPLFLSTVRLALSPPPPQLCAMFKDSADNLWLHHLHIFLPNFQSIQQPWTWTSDSEPHEYAAFYLSSAKRACNLGRFLWGKPAKCGQSSLASLSQGQYPSGCHLLWAAPHT